MVITAASIGAAFVFLVAGVLLYAAVNRLAYPRLRWRYERAKAYGRRATSPHLVMGATKILALVGLPVLGFFVGNVL